MTEQQKQHYIKRVIEQKEATKKLLNDAMKDANITQEEIDSLLDLLNFANDLLKKLGVTS